jgi:hypothetical protein
VVPGGNNIGCGYIVFRIGGWWEIDQYGYSPSILFGIREAILENNIPLQE